MVKSGATEKNIDTVWTYTVWLIKMVIPPHFSLKYIKQIGDNTVTWNDYDVGSGQKCVY